VRQVFNEYPFVKMKAFRLNLRVLQNPVGNTAPKWANSNFKNSGKTLEFSLSESVIIDYRAEELLPEDNENLQTTVDYDRSI